MKRFIIAILASVLGVGVTTVTFPQTANADYPDNRRPYDRQSDRPQDYERRDRPNNYREDRGRYDQRRDRPNNYREDRGRYDQRRDRPNNYREDRRRYDQRRDRPNYNYSEYYRPQDYRGNYSRRRSGVQLVIPLIIR